MANDNKKKTPAMDDVLFHQKPDRRLLSYAPDVTGHRTNRDRRGRDLPILIQVMGTSSSSKMTRMDSATLSTTR